MEAEDRDNVSDDEIEDSDADSDDEIFIENDESSEEEGGNLTPKELMALQPRLWNHKKKIVIRGKSSELDPLQEYSRTILFQSSTGSYWIYRIFENKLGNTLFHAFLRRSDSLSDPDLPVESSHAERLDFNIVIDESIKSFDKTTSLSIRSFVVYKKICAFDFIEMIFKNFPKVSKILYPSSHRGLETAIKKSVFKYVNDEYIIQRPER